MKTCLTISLCLLSVLATAQVSVTPNYQEGFIKTSDGNELFYQKVGKGKETLVIPAGFFLFEDFKHLSTDRTVIFYDMRNRGRSSYIKDTSQIGINKDVADLETIRRHFKLTKMDLIGWSYLGLMVALYTQQYPQFVSKIVQIGPVPIQWNERFADSLTYNIPEAVDTMYLPVVKSAFRSGMNERNPELLSKLIFELLEKPKLIGDPAAAREIGCHWGTHTRFFNEQYTQLMRHLQIHFVGSIQGTTFSKAGFQKIRNRVLIIHGTRDLNAPFGGGKQWATILPNSKFVRVEKAGHIPWVEQPKLVFESIHQFLKE